MFPKPNKNQTLALAGLFQASALVNQLATKDRHDVWALHESAFSLIRLDADDIEEVYGSKNGVDLGLRTMVKLFTSRPDASTRDIYQYTVGAHQLSAKLFQLERTSAVIHSGLEKIRDDHADFYDEETHDEKLYESLAGLYSQTISYLTPRIMVQGPQLRLQKSEIVHRVRAALFSGVRSAYLWHQLGGRKWQLLFNRKDYVHIAGELING